MQIETVERPPKTFAIKSSRRYIEKLFPPSFWPAAASRIVCASVIDCTTINRHQNLLLLF